MALSIEKPLRRLQFDDINLCQLKEEIIKSLKDRSKLVKIFDHFCDNRSSVNCFSCEHPGICALLIGIIHLALSNYEKAILEIENANQHLRGQDETWNLINGMELLGWAYELGGNRHQALLEYKEALRILNSYYIPTHSNDHKTARLGLQKELVSWISKPLPEPPKREENYFEVGWIPVYSTVQAGPNGPIWIDPFPDANYPGVSSVTIGRKIYYIISLTGEKSVVLRRNNEYGWSKVQGDSMDCSKPVPIQPRDYVLFRVSDYADDRHIVLASKPDKTGAGFEYVVKRYDKKNHRLLSETNPPNKYPPVPLTRDDRILGIVIAVAKPIQT